MSENGQEPQTNKGRLKYFIEKILELDPKKIRRVSELGTTDALISAENILRMFQSLLGRFDIESLNGDEIPDNFGVPKGGGTGVIENAGNSLEILFQAWEMITTTSVQTGDDNARQTLIDAQTKIEEQYHTAYGYICNIYPLMQASNKQIDREVQRAKKSTEEIGAKAEEIEKILKQMQKHASETVISREAQHYETLKNDYGKKEKIWLCASIVVGFVVIAAPIALLLWAPSITDDTFKWHLLTSKYFIFAILAYALYTCIRNYLAIRHNVAINEQRAAALKNYQVLVTASGLQDAKDIILTVLASSIYTTQPTGYIKQDSGNSQTQIPIINQILAAVRESTKKGGN